jgi:DNA-binding phage protein
MRSKIEIDDWEKIKAVRVAELLENNTLFQKEDICSSIRHLVSRFSNSNITEFSRKVQVPKTTLWSWYSGKNVPPLEDVLRICNKFGVSLIEFYSNKLSFEKFPVIPAKRKGKVNINFTLKTLYEIGRNVKVFVKSQKTQSVTVTAMAKKLACNKKTLYKHFNKHCRAQATRSTQHRRDLHEVKFVKRQLEVESAFLNVIKRGHIPSLHSVSGSLGKPGIMRDPAVRLKLKSLFADRSNTKYGERDKNVV